MMESEQSTQSPESNPNIERLDHTAIVRRSGDAATVVPESKTKAKPKPKPKHELWLVPLGADQDSLTITKQVQKSRILVVVGHGSCEDRVEQVPVGKGFILSYTRVSQKIYHTQAKKILSRLDIGEVLSKVDPVHDGEELQVRFSNDEYGDYNISFGDDKLKRALHRDLGYYVYDPEEKLGNKLIGFKDWRHYSPLLEPPQGDFVRMSDIIRFKEKLKRDSEIQHILFIACKEIISEEIISEHEVSGKMTCYSPSPTRDAISLKTSNAPDVLIIFGAHLTDQDIKTRRDLTTRYSELKFEFAQASDDTNIAFIMKSPKAQLIRLIHIEGGHENLSGHTLASAVVGRLKVDQDHLCEACLINAGLPEDDDERITQLCESHLQKNRPFQVACWHGEVSNEIRRKLLECFYMEYRPNMTLADAVGKASSLMLAYGHLPLFVTSTKVSLPSSLEARRETPSSWCCLPLFRGGAAQGTSKMKMHRLVNVTLEMTPKENELDTWNDFIENVMRKDSSFWRNHFSCGSQVAWVEVVIQTVPRILKPQALTLADIRCFEEQLQKQLGVEEVRFSGFGSVILCMYVSSFVELRSRWDMAKLEICTPEAWGAGKVIVTDISLGTQFWAQFMISQEHYLKINLYETMQQHLHEHWNINVDVGYEDSKRQHAHREADDQAQETERPVLPFPIGLGDLEGEMSTMRILLDEMQSSSNSNSSGNPDKKKLQAPRQGATTIPKMRDNTDFIDVEEITHKAWCANDLRRSDGNLTVENLGNLTVKNLARHEILHAQLPQAQEEIEGHIKMELSKMRMLLEQQFEQQQSSSSSNCSGNSNKKRVPTPRQGATTIPQMSDNTDFIGIMQMTYDEASNELRKEVELWSDLISTFITDCQDIAGELLSIVFDNGATLVVHAPYYELLKLFDRSTAVDDFAFFNHLVNNGANTIKKQSSERFRHWHRAFSRKWPSDKFPDDYEVESLRGKRTDGYFGISSSGNVCLAAALFAPVSRAPLAFKGKGASHRAALDIALKLKHCIVFVKSGSGTVHVLTAGGVRNKEAYCLVADAAD